MWRLGMLAFALVGCSQIFGLDVPTVMQANDAGPTAVTIGGQVHGLGTASGLVLQNNGGDDKPIVSDGDYVFATPVPVGSPYDVTVSVQPTNPSETCAVTNGSGTTTSFNVGGAIVQCAPATYLIGGTVQGLSGSVTLHNGSDTLTITSNGAFTFPTAVLSGQMYAVTASGNAACTVFGGSGTVGDGDVTSVLVNCSSSAGPYAIGGMVSGLNGTVRLHDSSNGDTVTISSNGTYAFPMLVLSGGSYNVTVMQQPAYPPASQTCTVSNGTGTAGGNVQNINVTCTTKTFIIGGNVAELDGTVVLQNNGADDLTQTGPGSFAFTTPVASGAPYSVTVKTAPPGEQCSVANGTGTVQNGTSST